MRDEIRRLSVVCCTILSIFTITSTAGFCSGKITSDPNVSGSQPNAAKEALFADERLDQKVDFSGYKRLHEVVDELSQKTGVAIFCGSNSRDWKVRDIPVTVCVRDMQLGRLLSGLAAATHTVLSTSKSESVSKTTYRIYRDLKAQRSVDALISDRARLRVQQADWAWDALVKFAAMSESFQEKNAGWAGNGRWPVAKLLASLGPDAKRKVFDGEQITLKATDPAYSDIIRSLYRKAWDDQKANFDKEGKLPEPLSSQIESALLDINIVDAAGENNQTSVHIELSPIQYPSVQYGWGRSISDVAVDLREAEGLDLPPFPREGEILSAKDDMPDKSLEILESKRDWNNDLLNTRFKLKSDDPKDQRLFNKVLAAAANGAGINIIAEDFTSHKGSDSTRPVMVSEGDTTAGKVLRDLSQDYEYPCTFFINKSEKLVVCWAQDSRRSDGRNWRNYHANLVPQAYIQHLIGKVDKCLDLDDLTPAFNLTTYQLMDWVAADPQLPMLRQFYFPGSLANLWRIYDLLSPEQKALAKSESGLPLGQLDWKWASVTYASLEKHRPCPVARGGSVGYNDRVGNDQKLAAQVFSDPQLLAKAVMCVKDTVLENKKHTYTVQLTGEINGEQFRMESRWTREFPVCSEKNTANKTKKSGAE